jgi:Fe-S-cluster containining protein
MAPIKPSQNGKRTKPPRDTIPPGENLCSYCTAKCCRYFALPIDTPDCWKDFQYMRWFLLHSGAAVFTEGDVWYLLVYSACRHLRDDQLCGIYPTRPPICREYTTAKCEYEDSWVYDRYLETAEQVMEYAEAVLGPQGRQSIRSPRPRKATS